MIGSNYFLFVFSTKIVNCTLVAFKYGTIMCQSTYAVKVICIGESKKRLESMLRLFSVFGRLFLSILSQKISQSGICMPNLVDNCISRPQIERHETLRTSAFRRHGEAVSESAAKILCMVNRDKLEEDFYLHRGFF